MPRISAPDLLGFATELLRSGGFSETDAAQTADLLVWANLRGTDSHGVLRIPRYVEMLEQGIIRTGGKVVTVHAFGAVTLLDGGKCPGAVGMNTAVAQAAELARQHGIGWCSARNISHAGAVGYFADALARLGFVGVVMSASKPLMSYFGAKGEALSTNPLAISAPVQGADPVVLDMSTAAVALGKISVAKDAGKPIPLGWAMDENGAETTDPNRVTTLMPMAGAKGSGLSLMIEVLTSVLAGNAVIGPVLTGKKAGGFNGLVIAVDPAAFGDLAAFDAEMKSLIAAIHALPPVEADAPVLLPGERGVALAQRNQVEGVALEAGTVRRLIDLADLLGVAVPAAFCPG